MKRRRLKKARIKFLSLCPKGANKMRTILKDDGAFEVRLLSKGMDDNGELNAIVYAPEFTDSQGDFASASVIKDMAYAAARDGVEIDVRHDGKGVGSKRAFVAENFIVQKGDTRFEDLKDYAGKPVDATGAWGVVIKIEDPELRKLYQEGGWKGISMAGEAEVEQEKADDVVDRVMDALSKRLETKNQTLEEDMPLSEEDLKKIEDQTTAIVTKVLEGFEKSKHIKAEDEKKKKNKSKVKKEAPEFEGDPTKPEDVAKHVKALCRHKLETSLDWSDAEAVAKHAEALAELAKSGKNDGGGDENKAEIEKLQAKITKLQSHSRQGSGTPPTTSTTTVVETMRVEGLTKSDELDAALKAGAAMAAYSNSQRGFGSR